MLARARAITLCGAGQALMVLLTAPLGCQLRANAIDDVDDKGPAVKKEYSQER